MTTNWYTILQGANVHGDRGPFPSLEILVKDRIFRERTPCKPPPSHENSKTGHVSTILFLKKGPTPHDNCPQFLNLLVEMVKIFTCNVWWSQSLNVSQQLTYVAISLCIVDLYNEGRLHRPSVWKQGLWTYANKRELLWYVWDARDWGKNVLVEFSEFTEPWDSPRILQLQARNTLPVVHPAGTSVISS